MTNGDLNWIANYIWGIADDVLRDVYVRGKYRDVILPMTVLRRLDAVLEPTKQAVLDMRDSLDRMGIVEQDGSLRQAAGQDFWNVSKFTLRDLRARASRQQLKADFEDYLDGFSPNVQDILENFEFRNQIPRLDKAAAPGTLIEKLTSPDVNLSPARDGDRRLERMATSWLRPGRSAIWAHSGEWSFSELSGRLQSKITEEATMAKKKGERCHNGRPDVPAVRRRRLLGAYYTPDELALVLVRWALAGGRGPVLDPSYGGCAFLDAAARVLSERDPGHPGRGVYGVDIDPLCANTVHKSACLVDANCIVGDFLDTSHVGLPGSPFAAIVGNPPYVRHHWIKGNQWESARSVVADAAIPLPATASLWAYFLLHSLSFLAPGGRLAMLVPEAILQADYAAPLREGLAKRFRRTRLIYIRNRLFDATDEPVVVVACSGFGEQGDISAEAVESVEDIESALAASNGRSCQADPSAIRVRRADPQALAVLQRIQTDRAVRRFSGVATVRVGLVTGANSHFIRSQQDLDTLGLPARVRHCIVPRARWLKGLGFDAPDHDPFVDAGVPALLVCPEHAHDDHLVEPWIAEGIERGVNERYKCAVRDDWFRVDLPSTPDAFATCTRAGSPLLVLNRGRFHCSNAIHRVMWSPDLPVTPEAAAVGFLTSAVSVWAELNGRRYGGGVLKIEPGTLNRIPVPLVPGSEDVFDDLDRLIRDDSEEEARELADERVLQEGLGLDRHEVDCLQGARSKLMKWRRPSRAGNGHA